MLPTSCRPPTKSGPYGASPGCRRFRLRDDMTATAMLPTASRNRSRERLSLMHLHDVGLQTADRREDFLLLGRRHLEFRERLVQVLHRDVPIGLGDMQPGMGLLHAAADVVA